MTRYIQYLTHQADKWAGQVLYYSFKRIPIAMSQQTPDFRHSLTRQLSSTTQALVLASLEYWQNMTSIRFEQRDNNPDFHILGSHLGPSILGYSGVGVHSRYHPVLIDELQIEKIFKELGTATFELIAVINHEIGHAMGLMHFFSSPDMPYSHFLNSTYFSIMNYDYFHDNGVLYQPITLMPADIKAAQLLYGENAQQFSDDTLYDISQFTRKMPTPYKSVASLPWDAGGTDTLSARGILSPVVLNIRPFHVSETIDGHVWTPDIALENVVSGGGMNAIYLNEWDNIVDISHANETLLFVEPRHSGHDLIIGFNPLTDRLILEYGPQDSLPLPITIQNAWEPCLDNEQIDCPVTHVVFSEQDSVSLFNVTSQELKSDTIQTHPKAPIGMRDLFDINKTGPTPLLSSLSIDFMQALLAGIVLGIFIELLDYVLLKQKYTPNEAQRIKTGLGFLYVLYFGGILNVGVGMVSNLLLSQAKLFSPEINEFINYCLTHFIDYQDLSAVGGMKKITKHIGVSTGSFFTSSVKSLFFKNKGSVEQRTPHESGLEIRTMV